MWTTGNHLPVVYALTESWGKISNDGRQVVLVGVVLVGVQSIENFYIDYLIRTTDHGPYTWSAPQYKEDSSTMLQMIYNAIQIISLWAIV